MPSTITIFANLTNPTLPELDGNFAILGALAPVPCSVSGSNAITMSQGANQFAIVAYQNGLQLSGVAVSDNTGATTARLGSLGILNVYKDTPTGPVILSGGEIQQDCAFTLLYDSTLNTGSGGWHLFASTATVGSTINPGAIKIGSLTGATLTRLLTTQVSVTFTVVPANTTQDQNVSLTGAAIGDSISIGPPSAALAGVGYTAFVPAAGTVTLRAINPTAASLTPTGGLYRLTALGFT